MIRQLRPGRPVVWPEPVSVDQLVMALEWAGADGRPGVIPLPGGSTWVVGRCPCWVCDGLCDGSCGSMTLAPRGPICATCRSAGTAYDDDRVAIVVRARDNRVVVRIDAGNGWPATIRLAMEDASDVAVALVRALAEVTRYECDEMSMALKSALTLGRDS